MKKWISLLIPTLLLFSISLSQQKYSQVRIPVQSKSEIRRLAELGLAVDHVGAAPGRWIDQKDDFDEIIASGKISLIQ
jgi:hypothetical protein